MKTGRLIFLTIVFGSLFPGILPGQGLPADLSSVTGNLSRYTEDNPYEEVFLHTDRETYAAGETVRLSAWLFSCPDLILARKNSYAYAELLDYHGYPVSQVVIRLENGTGESQMTLPDTLVTGSYLLRAYTAVTRNYLPRGCFMKRITVANPFRSGYLDYHTDLKTVDEQPVVVRFYPEGGNIVIGIPSLIGVFALNRYGYPVRCSGTVVNARDETVARVVVDSTGTGSLELIAEQGETYSFVPAATGLRFNLPAAADGGVTMKVTRADDNMVDILLRERSDTGVPARRGGFILIQSRGRVIQSFGLPPWNDSYAIGIPAARLKEGLVNIALFDENGQFTAERYIFIPGNSVERLKLTVSGATGRRQKVSLEIAVAGEPGELREESAGSLPVQAAGEPGELREGSSGSISVSVVAPGDNAMTASEYIISGSEFYNECIVPGLPAYPPQADFRHADNYLLGIKSIWIDWEKIASGIRDTRIFPAENDGRYLTVAQSASATGAPVDSKTVCLRSWGRTSGFQYSESDPDGRFRFFLGDDDNPEDIVISPLVGAIPLPLRIESPFSEKRIPNRFLPDTASFPTLDKITGRITDRYQIGKIYQLKDSVTVHEVKTGEKPERRFYGIPDQELRLDDYISLSSMREIFFELVKRLIVRPDKNGEGLQIWDPVLRRSPALFIDQVPVRDAGIVLGLDPARVKRIDVVSGDYLLGDIVFPGLVNVVTRKGTYSDSPLPAGAIRSPFRLHDPATPFIIPDHTEKSGGTDRIPDFRNTEYWHGRLTVDSTGTFRCEFITSDDAGDYIVTVNVTDGNGRPVSLRQKISFPGH
jgi:hypothetical protein